jgi:hypothetical protein
MDFYKFFDKINGPAETDSGYDLANYEDLISNGKSFNREKNSDYGLRPIQPEDIATTSAEDAAEWYAKHGKNTTKLGNSMSDEEFQKFHGLK